jgi:predicted RNase H-like nuclease (RuvC/YqgF family)
MRGVKMKHKRPHVHTRTSKRGKKFTVNPDIMKGKKPSNSLMTRYKHLPYKKLKKQFLINPHADDDNDGVINKKDCRPWDKTKQHLFSDNDKTEEYYDEIENIEFAIDNKQDERFELGKELEEEYLRREIAKQNDEFFSDDEIVSIKSEMAELTKEINELKAKLKRY